MVYDAISDLQLHIILASQFLGLVMSSMTEMLDWNQTVCSSGTSNVKDWSIGHSYVNVIIIFFLEQLASIQLILCWMKTTNLATRMDLPGLVLG